MGREITASLDFETIFGKLYDRVNELADADVFGVGLYHRERNEIEYRLAIEKGKRYAPYTRDTTNPDQLPVWCIEHREPVFINDIATEATRYITATTRRASVSRTARCRSRRSRSSTCRSCSKDRALGIITIQSLREERVYGASPERDAEPGVLHGHRAGQRRRLSSAQRARARDPPSVRGGREGAIDRGGGRRRQERVPVDGQPRAAHSADLGPRLREDHPEATRGSNLPARRQIRHEGQPGRQAGRRQPPGRRERGRAPHQADRRRAGPREDRGRQTRMAHGERRRRGHHRPRHGRHVLALRSEGPAPREAGRVRPAVGNRRSRSADSGRHQPDLQRGQIHEYRQRHLQGRAPRGRTGGQRDRHWPRHRAERPAEGLRAVQAGRRHAHRQTEGHGPRPADLQGDRRAPRRTDLGRERARAPAARSRSRSRSPSSRAPCR